MLAHALWCTKNLKGGWDGCSLLAEKRERLASCKKSVIIMAGKNEFISGSKKALYTIIRPSILVAETLSLFHFHTSFCATWVFDLENSCSFNERVGRPPPLLGTRPFIYWDDWCSKTVLLAIVCLEKKSNLNIKQCFIKLFSSHCPFAYFLKPPMAPIKN